ncbi:TAXI family TRAP transporter solute-binding subunit [Sneathiella marina]|uniref:TAXI family TRAP transporter solute-binding subunit n=1 Tax=Sneathiella marina TaxID=2950108 RepID=A0ABY4W8X9_9PROT|nr:TAXI family TRAP transporter solute-binding subunit [Sneathiella marina]USG61729.1 TAXI family TRAP transporter solute-binding subunit [Sneathiella marina]
MSDKDAPACSKIYSNIFTRQVAPVLMIVFSLLLVPIGQSIAQDISFFRIGTGSSSGTYYPIGTLIGSVISSPPGSRACEDGGSCGVPGLIVTGQTTRGSIANIEGVMAGSLETGLAQSDMVQAAYTGTGVYRLKEPAKNLRVIANLYPENIHLVVRRDAGIANISQLRGKRISLDVPGSGTRENAKLILSAYGIAPLEYQAIPVNADKAVGMMLNKELDAFFFVAGYPVTAVSELADTGIIDLLPIDGKVAAKIVEEHSYYSLSEIPANVYEGVAATPSLAVSTQWVVNANMEDDVVYEVTRALWHPNNRALLDNGHLKGKHIRLETALDGIATPLHAGAEKYYRENGMIKN